VAVAFSPDLSAVWEVGMAIWIRELDEGTNRRLTFEGESQRPEWTADGSAVTYYVNRDEGAGSTDFWTKAVDGSGQASLELDVDRDILEMAWSSDGQWLVYRTTTLDRGFGDILARPRERDAEHLILAATEASERHPTLSPNGRWLAYTSDENGRDEVFVIPFPEGGGKWIVSSAGGTEPAWAHSGRELFYRSSEGDIVAVPVVTDGTFSMGAPSVLFSALDYFSDGYHPHWDPGPEDNRFIMVRQLGRDQPGRVVLVQNFLTELNERVGR
jgi:dipeptidyl aminopeptidase/acylaminoacyl peptidase